MDALDVLAVTVRRWYVFLTIVLLSVFAGLALAQDRTPTYAATGDFAVIYRPDSILRPGQPDPRQQNPMSNNGLLKASIVADLRSAQSQKELGADGVVGTDPSTAPDGSSFALVTERNSDTVTVEAYGADKDQVAAVVQGVLAAAADRATEIQDRVGAPADGRLTTFVTLPTQVVQLPPASGTKLLVGVVGVGVITGAALSLLVDTALRKRRLRREQTEADGEGEGEAADGGAAGNGQAASAPPVAGSGPSKRKRKAQRPAGPVQPQARPTAGGGSTGSEREQGASAGARSGTSASR